MTVNLERLNKFLAISYDTIYHEPDTPNFHNKLIDQIYQELIVPMNLDKQAAILDIGCGSGYFLNLLKKDEFTNAVGITLDDEDLEKCNSVFQVNAVKSDFTFTEFESNSFDFVWCRQSIEHSVWPFFTLLEINRLLKDKAKVYIEVPATDTSRENEANPNHYSVMGKKMWMELFKRAGFNINFENTFTFTMSEQISDSISVDHTESFYLFVLEKAKDFNLGN
jgi:SAM-dependent methyltransferase